MQQRSTSVGIYRNANVIQKPEETEIREIDAPTLSKELKKRWSYFIRKVYETDPLSCPKCQSEMRIISFIDQPDVIIPAEIGFVMLTRWLQR